MFTVFSPIPSIFSPGNCLILMSMGFQNLPELTDDEMELGCARYKQLIENKYVNIIRSDRAAVNGINYIISRNKTVLMTQLGGCKFICIYINMCKNKQMLNGSR